MQASPELVRFPVWPLFCPRLVGEVLTVSTVTLKGCGNGTGDVTKVKVWMKTEIFEQTL